MHFFRPHRLNSSVQALYLANAYVRSQAAPAKAAAASSSSSEESDSDSEDEKPKAAAVKAAPAAKKAAAPSSDSDDSDSDSDSEETPAVTASKTPAAAKEDSSDSDSDSDSDDSDDSDAKPATKAAAAPKKAAAATAESSEDDSSEDSDDSEDDDGDATMKDGTEPAAVSAGGKRKAESDAVAPAKKAKLDADDAEASTNAASNTIWIGNLSWNVDDDWLKTEFESYGELVSARVQMDRNTGRSRGFGYVEFKELSSAQAAVDDKTKEIDGRAPRVDFAPARTAPDPTKRAKAFNDTVSAPSAILFVGNLAFDATEDACWYVGLISGFSVQQLISYLFQGRNSAPSERC